MPTATALRVGDRVSAAVGCWGKEWATNHGATNRNWRSEEIRHEGDVVRRAGAKWVVDFADDKLEEWDRYVSEHGLPSNNSTSTCIVMV